MIIVRITSGLGNQMYQYNFYRFIKELYPQTQVKADITWFYANDEHHGYELERIFGSNPKNSARNSGGKDSENGDGKNRGSVKSEFEMDIASTKEIYRATGQIPNFCNNSLGRTCQYLLGPVNRILREKIHKGKSYNIIDRLESDRTDSFYEDVTNLDVTKDWYLFGFWIEEDYYRGRVEKLRKELVFPDFTEGENLTTVQKMKEGNSVSLHVRRGDYLSATYSGKFLTLGRDYYEKAVNIIRDRVENPEFYIFSDDEEFVKQEFTWLDNKTIITNNKGNDSYKDMQLMSNCKHNIIANSTFSQWGALLNVNAGHLTVYPAAYMTDEESEVKTMDGYIRVK